MHDIYLCPFHIRSPAFVGVAIFEHCILHTYAHTQSTTIELLLVELSVTLIFNKNVSKMKKEKPLRFLSVLLDLQRENNLKKIVSIFSVNG